MLTFKQDPSVLTQEKLSQIPKSKKRVLEFALHHN